MNTIQVQKHKTNKTNIIFPNCNSLERSKTFDFKYRIVIHITIDTSVLGGTVVKNGTVHSLTTSLLSLIKPIV